MRNPSRLLWLLCRGEESREEERQKQMKETDWERLGGHVRVEADL